MDFLSGITKEFLAFASNPWFSIGNTPISLQRLLGLLIILILVWWLSSLIERGLRHAAVRGKTLSDSGVYTLSRIVRYTVWILGTVVGLNYIGFSLASFALIGGAIGVGVGFGLQNIFSNFISGIIILLEKTLKVGDFIDLESGVRGHVREIGVRYTRITTNDAVDVIVPNSEFVNHRVINWTFDNRYHRLHIPFGVAYGVDKGKVREAALAAARRVDGNIEDENRKPDLQLVKFGDSSLDFELVVWVGPERVARPGNTHAQYLWAIEDELRAHGIEIPFPQRDL
ncbi:MAG: mechanosensitive ion channel family protein, partial [Burkholderiales bacterium]